MDTSKSSSSTDHHQLRMGALRRPKCARCRNHGPSNLFDSHSPNSNSFLSFSQRRHFLAKGPQASLPVQGLPLRQMQFDCRTAASHGRPGNNNPLSPWPIFSFSDGLFAFKVALKRQQATEDAIALGLRSVASGTRMPYLPPGPIFGDGGGRDSKNDMLDDTCTSSASSTRHHLSF